MEKYIIYQSFRDGKKVFWWEGPSALHDGLVNWPLEEKFVNWEVKQGKAELKMI